jgi:hypothetical protein
MQLPRYTYKTNATFLDYEFDSAGPKGAIKKVVRFTLVSFPAFSYYNLGFGDWNEKENTIDDFVVSNNRDAERVLATVAGVIIDFTNHYPEAVIYAEGSRLILSLKYMDSLKQKVFGFLSGAEIIRHL